jgi:hypothetical protein
MVFRLQTQLLIHCSEMWYGQSTTYSCHINDELARIWTLMTSRLTDQTDMFPHI